MRLYQRIVIAAAALVCWSGGFAPAAFGQNAADSLRAKLRTSLPDSTRVRYLLELSDILRETDFKAAVQQAQQAIRLADDADLGPRRVLARKTLGNLYNADADYPRAIEQYLSAQTIAKEIGYQKGVAELDANLGAMYYAQGAYDKAMRYYQAALANFQKLKETAAAAAVEQYIGLVYEDQGHYSQAVTHYMRTLNVSLALGDRPGVARAYNYIGSVYLHASKMKLALDYFMKALNLELQLQNRPNIAACYNNLGTAYSTNKQYEKSIEFNLKAIKIQKEIGDRIGEAASLNNIGNAHLRLHRYDKSVGYYLQALETFIAIGSRIEAANTYKNIGEAYALQGAYPKAIDFLQRGLAEARAIGAKRIMEECYEYLADTYAKMERFEKAHYYAMRLAETKDSIYDAESNRLMSELEVRYRAEQKEQEIAYANQTLLLQASELERQKDARNLLAGLVGLGVVLLGVLFNRYRFREKASRLLQAQNDEINQKNEALLEVNRLLSEKNDEIFYKNSELEKAYRQINDILSEVSLQKKEIEIRNLKIEDSILYAQKIQQAILPPAQELQRAFAKHTLFFRPKDVVSGDFYWCGRQGNLSFLAVMDCTGHGVPGAFMSLIGANLLNDVINEFHLVEVDKILFEIDKRLRLMLGKDENAGIGEGMDSAICVLDHRQKTLDYGGAARPLIRIRDGELTEWRPPKREVGGARQNIALFEKYTIEVSTKDRFYLFSDGLTDQFCGPTPRRKLTTRRLHAWLIENASLPLEAQGAALSRYFDEWTGDAPQLDDVTLLGFEI